MDKYRALLIISVDQNKPYFIVSKSEKNGMCCNFERVIGNQQESERGKIMELNSVMDVKPDGYRVKIHYMVFGIKRTGIVLSSAESENIFYKSQYRISMNDLNCFTETIVHLNFTFISNYSP